MPVADHLSRVAMIPTAPVLYAQGKRLRRDTPILPDAAKPWTGSVAGPNPLRLLVLGDSTACGVGAATQDEALPGHLSRALQRHWSRGVEWRAMGRSGCTARDLLDDFIDDASADSYDLVFLTIGANDALKLRTRSAFVSDVSELLMRLRSASPTAPIIMSSLPAFFRFELLPQPLKANLYRHSSALESGARAAVDAFPNASMSSPPPPYTEGFFASDMFHPSAKGYRDWADLAIDEAFATGALV
jgi:lysophospholipase L1-like esterase